MIMKLFSLGSLLVGRAAASDERCVRRNQVNSKFKNAIFTLYTFSINRKLGRCYIKNIFIDNNDLALLYLVVPHLLIDSFPTYSKHSKWCLSLLERCVQSSQVGKG